MAGKSRRLKHNDIRRVFHLIGEITELGRDPVQWRLHLIHKLLPLVEARIGFVGEHYINPTNPADTRVVGTVDWGWAPGEQELFYGYLNSGGMARDPLHAQTSRLLFRSYTRRRRDLVPDEIWYASPVVDPLRRQCNVDDTIYARCRLPQLGWAHFLSVMKAWGAKPFSERDRLLVSLLHRELERLWAHVDHGALASLPARLRQTLDLIFSGYSEKQMADALNVSAHTAHDFCRRLYRHFDVTGRGQLLTNPACRQLLFRPALSPAYYAARRGDSDGDFPQPQDPS
jgi:DNA-binding CsgD family transcriptional regulator